jgi:hypothetical protein
VAVGPYPCRYVYIYAGTYEPLQRTAQDDKRLYIERYAKVRWKGTGVSFCGARITVCYSSVATIRSWFALSYVSAGYTQTILPTHLQAVRGVLVLGSRPL